MNKKTDQTEVAIEKAIKALLEQRTQEAAIICRTLLSDNPEEARAWHHLSTSYLQCNLLFEAIACLEHALRLNYTTPETHHNYALCQINIGNFDLAEKHLREALNLKPDYTSCYSLLAESRKLSSKDPLFKKATEIADDEGVDLNVRRPAAFAVGHVLWHEKAHDDAMVYYDMGNGMGPHSNAQPDEVSKFVDRSIQFFSEKFFNSYPVSGVKDPSPIFVVGMPRSGTSLVERILSCHSSIRGVGELPDINSMINSAGPQFKKAYPDLVLEMPQSQWHSFGNQYIQRVKSMAFGARRTVDKQPNNAWFLGFISLLFPESTIIYCSRTPLDIAMSCYRSNFARGQEWSFSKAALCWQIENHRRIMSHWKSVLPDRIHEVQYEELVTNPEYVIRDMVMATGLKFEEGCLHPEENKGIVQTASYWQARQPINQKSLGHEDFYKKYFEGLI